MNQPKLYRAISLALLAAVLLPGHAAARGPQPHDEPGLVQGPFAADTAANEQVKRVLGGFPSGSQQGRSVVLWAECGSGGRSPRYVTLQGEQALPEACTGTTPARQAPVTAR